MSKQYTDSSQADPPGYSRQPIPLIEITPEFATGYTVPSGRSAETIKNDLETRAMTIARGQFGELFQVALMMYMFIGNQLNIYSIFFLLSMGTAPIRKLFSVNQAFASIQNPNVDIVMAKILYFVINLAGTGVFFYKLRSMGLLPITAADWISLLPTRTPIEYSSISTNPSFV